MEHTEREVTVLFTDISGYTGFVSRQGNIAAVELLHRHNELLRPVIDQYGGTFVKGTGDGLIAHFADPRRAVEAAVVIYQRLAAYNLERTENEEIHIRAALHVGEAVLEEGEIIGAAVNVAARLVAVCKRDQILISEDVYRRVRRLKHLSFVKAGRAKLQGLPGEKEVFSVSWELADFREKRKSLLFPSHHKPLMRRVSLAVLGVALGIVLIGYLYSNRLGFEPPPSTSRSIPSEAKQLYDLALQYEVRADDEQAVQALQQAVALDPTFAEAHLELAFLYYDMEEYDSAREHAARADSVSDGLADEFKLKVRAFRAQLDGEYEKAVQLFRLLVDRYPQETDAFFYLAEAAVRAGRLEEAKSSLSRCVQVEPLNPYCNYGLMMMLVRENKFDEVLRSYKSLREKKVEYLWLDVPAGLAYWGTDSLGPARQKLGNLAVPRSHGFRPHGTVHFETAKEWLADISLYQGRLREAQNHLELLRSHETTPNASLAFLIYIARVDDLLGGPKGVRSRLLEHASTSQDPAVRIEVAKTFAHLGAGDLVEKLLREHSDDAKKLDLASSHLLQGAIAFHQNRLNEAAEKVALSFELSNDLETLALLTQVQMSRGAWQQASELSRRMIASKGRILADYNPVLWALAHYNLAVCYDNMGHRQLAREYYSKFLKIWSAADANLVKIQHAVDRLKAMRDS